MRPVRTAIEPQIGVSAAISAIFATKRNGTDHQPGFRTVWIVCATLDLRQCDANNACLTVTPEEVDAPRLLRIDLAGKTVTASRADGTTWQSAIENSEEVDEKIIIQGAEDGSQNRRDGVGWTLTISKTTGRMSMAAAGDDVVFVGFGACAAL